MCALPILGSILPNQLLAAHDPSIVFNFKAVKADGIPTELFIDKMHLNPVCVNIVL